MNSLGAQEAKVRSSIGSISAAFSSVVYVPHREVSSGEERELLSRKAAGNPAYVVHTATPEEMKTQQSPVVLYFCLRESRPGKLLGSPDSIVLEKVGFPSIRELQAAGRFQIPSGGRAFSKSFVFVTDYS